MKRKLLWKLVGLQAIVLTVVVALVLLLSRLSFQQIAAYFRGLEVPHNAGEKVYFDFFDQYFVVSAILVGLLTLGITFFVTRRILTPLSQLAAMAQRISAGDYTARVKPAKRGELGQVTLAFNQMAASLQQTDDLRKSLISNVAHELRTPLTNIRGYLEALQDGVIPPSAETYRTLHDETLRIVRLVDDLVRLARADAAEADMAIEELDLDQLMRQVIKLFQPRLNSDEIQLQLDIDAIGTPITADRRKLIQVLTNLLDNACRYTPQGGKISVRGDRKDGHVKLVFSNPCEPIPERERELLFERFYRRDKSRSRELGGAGIGLAIVKQLVEAHGGRVGVDSLDSKINVWFTLPYHANGRPQ